MTSSDANKTKTTKNALKPKFNLSSGKLVSICLSNNLQNVDVTVRIIRHEDMLLSQLQITTVTVDRQEVINNSSTVM